MGSHGMNPIIPTADEIYWEIARKNGLTGKKKK